MTTKNKKLFTWLTISCVLLYLIFEVNAACVCHEKGIDHCNKCNDRRIVRPRPKYYEHNSELDLAPIGDNCWCSKLSIEPASLPKTCSKHKGGSCGCKGYGGSGSGSGGGSDSYNTIPFPTASPYASSAVYDVPETSNYVSSKSSDDSLPADPISVALAVQAGKADQVPEAKLAYGFIQKPVDDQKKIYLSSVPEENLFTLKNDVITLRRRTQRPQGTAAYEEPIEVEEDEYENNPADDGDDEPPQLTYKQLGYIQEEFKNPKFRRVHSSYDSDDDDDRGSVGPISVDCGFKPGRISTYRRKNRIQSNGNSNCY